MNEQQKNWIDNASYYTLLERWRNAPSGDTMFQGECGTYYAEAMKRKREEVGNEQHVAVSKDIGWNGR